MQAAERTRHLIVAKSSRLSTRMRNSDVLAVLFVSGLLYVVLGQEIYESL
jgi:hypothetical protein